MKPLVIVMAAVVVGLSTIAPATTFAQSPAPIQVTNLQYTEQGSEDEGGGSAVQPPGLMLTFKNVTSKPIHAVVFAVTDASGHQLGIVSRHGTFSPGVSVTRYFGDIRLKDKYGQPAKARPVQVGFKDGTTWNAP
jgi:hypothetical protein